MTCSSASMLSLLAAYLAGALTVFIVETGVLLFFIGRLAQRRRARSFSAPVTPDLAAKHSIPFLLNKQGMVWVAVMCLLDPYKDSKRGCNQQVKGLKEVKVKRDGLKEVPEVSPVQRHARIKDHVLILKGLDGSEELIKLEGCHVTAVSGGDQSSRKWAKRYPIKLENKNRALLYGSRVCFIYLETAWEKEAWCKALRLASRTDLGASTVGGADWYCKLKQEFEQYFQWLNEDYPSFLNLSSVFSNPKDSSIKNDAASSKVRLFLKKLAKKSSKTGNELKINSVSASNEEEKTVSDKACMNTDSSSLINFSSKVASVEKQSHNQLHTNSFTPSSLTLSSSGKQSQSSAVSDMDSENSAVGDIDGVNAKGITDQGTLCWNLLFSRLFFDVKSSTEVTDSIQALIQRLLSKVRTPNYIGGITCTRLDLGKLPPHICNMRVLPLSTDEPWAFDADIEYSGGALLDIETRLGVCEPGFQENIVGTGLESGIAGETEDFLTKGFESLGEQFENARDAAERKDGENSDGVKNTNIPGRRSSSMPSWKAMLSHLADQVSQVPLALSIRVLCLKGTVRIRIKPPPSDRIWFGFTSVPNIDWRLEPSIGDRKITSGPIAAFIASRIKAAICENLVLPNCADICIPWMMAEKDDWVPEKIAPLPWIRQESSEYTGSDASLKHLHENIGRKADGISSVEDPKFGPRKQLKDDSNCAKNMSNAASELAPGACGGISQNLEQTGYHTTSSSQPTAMRSLTGNGNGDLMMPLLEKDDLQSSNPEEHSEEHTGYLDTSVTTEQSFTSTEEKTKRGSKRVKMFDLGKKMGEKLEEKRRHIEEKSRLIVEKMRGVERIEGTGGDS